MHHDRRLAVIAVNVDDARALPHNDSARSATQRRERRHTGLSRGAALQALASPDLAVVMVASSLRPLLRPHAHAHSSRSIPCMHIELLDALGANLDALGPSVDHLTSLVADGAAALDMPQELDMPMSELKEKAFELDSLGSDVLIFLAASTFVVPLSRLAGISPVLGFLAIGCAIGPASCTNWAERMIRASSIRLTKRPGPSGSPVKASTAQR